MIRNRTLALVLMLGFGTAAVPAEAGIGTVGMGGVFRVPVVSFQERPFQTVVRQQFDYSCGSAALATLLSYHYGQKMTEVEIFKAMYEAGDKERIRELGFSLLDMKRYLATLGYRADGFRISIENLARVGVPAIALVVIDGYRHFVVVKGIANGMVLVGDPARGVRAYSQAEFEEFRVDDVVFLIRDRADVAKANFNKEEDWRLQLAAAPLSRGIDRRALADHGALARIPAQFRFPHPSGE